MIRTIEEVFAAYGFAAMDTPALEYSEILLGKGSAETDKQLYRFQDNGGRDIALRFDLTVPLARFIAMYANDLGIPFRRYAIGSVWRAEKPQRGRYREFIQCDIDTIGSDSPLADAEILAVIDAVMNKLDVRHKLRVNNRKILNGLLAKLNAQDRLVSVLRAIDKLEKLGESKVRAELQSEAQLPDSSIDFVFRYLELSTGNLSPENLFTELRTLLSDSPLGIQGVEELGTILEAAKNFGVSPDALHIDLSIARGLDYYTGLVCETQMLDLPDIGSIASGGRYDDLASLYTNRRLPGVGISIGLDRLLGGLHELGRIQRRLSPSDVLVTLLDDSVIPRALQLATELRSHGINVEVYPEVSQLGNQLKYCDKKGIPLAILFGERELQQNACAIKHLATKTQHDAIPFADVARTVGEILSRK